MDEKFYHDLLSRKLIAAGLEHLSRPRRELIHQGVVADVFEPDVVFSEKLVLELKCLTGGFEGEHYVQIICYQKFWKIGVGLLLDFGKESLSYRRVNFSEPEFQSPALDIMMTACPARESERPAALQMCEATRRVLAGHGLGYRNTTYAGLLMAELSASGLSCATNTLAEVRCGDLVLGQSVCPCLIAGHNIGVRVLALRQNISAAEVAILKTYLRLLGLDCGLILNFNRSSFEFRWISGRSCRPASNE